MQLEMDLRLRWWWKWQQTDELAVDAAQVVWLAMW
jgi:hypothetical protein